MSESARPRVCVVDDDADIRESLRFLFEEAAYEVEETADGEAALALLRRDMRPRVLLLDRMMPGLDGVQMLRRLDAEPEVILRHTVAIVTKPFNLDALLATVERASKQLAERGVTETE